MKCSYGNELGSEAPCASTFITPRLDVACIACSLVQEKRIVHLVSPRAHVQAPCSLPATTSLTGLHTAIQSMARLSYRVRPRPPGLNGRPFNFSRQDSESHKNNSAQTRVDFPPASLSRYMMTVNYSCLLDKRQKNVVHGSEP